MKQKLLPYYIVAKNCEDRLANMLTFQRSVMPEWETLDKLFIIEEDQQIPETYCNIVRMPFFRDGKILFSHLKNAAIDYALKEGYDWLLDCDADTAILKLPHHFPTSGYGAMRCYFTKQDESVESLLRMHKTRTFPFDASVGSSRFITHRHIFNQCRYYEGLSGYGGEDLDYHETVLPCAGFHTSETDAIGVHFWHPLNNRPHGKDDHEIRAMRRQVRDIMYAACQIQGWMSDVELVWLAQQAQEKRQIVEIGSWKGRSTKALAGTCPGKLYAVDDFSGGKDATLLAEVKLNGSQAIAASFRTSLARELAREKVVLIQKTSDQAFAELPKDVDMVFIDGDHAFESVRADIGIALRLLKPGGLLCGHDCNMAGVDRAIRETVGDYKFGPGSLWFKTV